MANSEATTVAANEQEILSDAAVLREFRGTVYHDVLSKYYTRMLEAKKDRVVSATRDDFQFWQGVYLGSKDVVLLPEALLAEAERIRDASNQRETT